MTLFFFDTKHAHMPVDATRTQRTHTHTNTHTYTHTHTHTYTYTPLFLDLLSEEAGTHAVQIGPFLALPLGLLESCVLVLPLLPLLPSRRLLLAFGGLVVLVLAAAVVQAE
jgi:hypothetical protein